MTGLRSWLRVRRLAAIGHRAQALHEPPRPVVGLAPLLREPARAAQLDWPDDDIDALATALADRREPFPAGWQLRPGASWSARGGLTTIVAQDPAEEPDNVGRRPSDRNVGTGAHPGPGPGPVRRVQRPRGRGRPTVTGAPPGGDPVEELLACMRRVERSRRTVVCLPADEARIRDAVERTGCPGLFTVVVSEFLPDGQALVFPDHVLTDLGFDSPL